MSDRTLRIFYDGDLRVTVSAIRIGDIRLTFDPPIPAPSLSLKSPFPPATATPENIHISLDNPTDKHIDATFVRVVDEE